MLQNREPAAEYTLSETLHKTIEIERNICALTHVRCFERDSSVRIPITTHYTHSLSFAIKSNIMIVDNLGIINRHRNKRLLTLSGQLLVMGSKSLQVWKTSINRTSEFAIESTIIRIHSIIINECRTFCMTILMPVTSNDSTSNDLLLFRGLYDWLLLPRIHLLKYDIALVPIIRNNYPIGNFNSYNTKFSIWQCYWSNILCCAIWIKWGSNHVDIYDLITAVTVIARSPVHMDRVGRKCINKQSLWLQIESLSILLLSLACVRL